MDEVEPGYLSRLGVPIMLGRAMLESVRGGAPGICVINEAFAKRFFERRNPIGMRITSSDDERRTTYQVVGVVKNARTQGVRDDVEPRYFVAARQDLSGMKSPIFLIRTAARTTPVMAAVRKAIQGVDAGLPIESARSIEEQMAHLTAQDRTTARLAVVFGCVALMLASIGLYGGLSYGITRRRGEMAVRIALGARPGSVVAMILRETAALAIAGLRLGGGLGHAGCG